MIFERQRTCSLKQYLRISEAVFNGQCATESVFVPGKNNPYMFSIRHYPSRQHPYPKMIWIGRKLSKPFSLFNGRYRNGIDKFGFHPYSRLPMQVIGARYHCGRKQGQVIATHYFKYMHIGKFGEQYMKKLKLKSYSNLSMTHHKYMIQSIQILLH